MSEGRLSPSASAHINDENATRDAIAEAIARRAAANTHEDDEERRFALERETRLKFRRLVDPGIARHSTPQQLEATLKMLATIANNLLSDPENERYQRFKPTNTLIKKNLVEVMGAVEYAIELGFRAEVENFQPFYKFFATPANMDNLRIGTAVLTETLDRMHQNAERERLNRVDPKAVQREIALKVKMQYEDDRKEKKRRDEREKQAREALAAKLAAAKSAPPSSTAAAAAPSSPDRIEIAEENDEEDDETLSSPLPGALPPSLSLMPSMHSMPAMQSRAPRFPGEGNSLRGDPPPYNQAQQPEEAGDAA